jgi:hypothetical protein
VQRDEIEHVVGVLNETIHDTGIDILQILEFGLPFQGIIYSASNYLHVSETIQFPTGRAPPSFSFQYI